MTKEEIKAYKRVRDIARKSVLRQPIPEDWRKILTYADEVMSCGEFSKEEHKHVYECDINSPISGMPVCNCGEVYSIKEEMGLSHQQLFEVKEPETFSKSLTNLLNKFSLEIPSDTPDFMLAEYLIDCLAAYNKITVWNHKWHSVDGVPYDERKAGPCLDRPNPTKSRII